MVLSAQITQGALLTTSRDKTALACQWLLVQHMDRKQSHYGYYTLKPRLNTSLCLGVVDGRAYITYQHVHLTEQDGTQGLEALWRIVPIKEGT